MAGTAKSNLLNVAKIQKLKEPGQYLDGLDLYFVVTNSGIKNWIFRYQVAGKKRDMGFGRYPENGLSEA